MSHCAKMISLEFTSYLKCVSCDQQEIKRQDLKVKIHTVVIWGVVIDTRGYSWIPFFLDTLQIFGIQVSKYPKKNMFLRQTS